jgi:tetratricopeptide (TPR) repeat protein
LKQGNNSLSEKDQQKMRSSTSIVAPIKPAARLGRWAVFAVCALSLVAVSGCAKLKSRDQMNQGVQAYKNNHYPDAIKHFKQAVELDPTNDNAQLYLATSYMSLWVPGADTPDNKKNYDMAKQEFQKVLDKEPNNSLALGSMAFMAFNLAATGTQEQKVAALEEARKWNQRRVEADPKDGEAYYYLGVIDYTEALGPISAARVEEKIPPNDPGPLRDAKVKEDLKNKYGKSVEDGIQQLQKALSIDKENEDAMSYLNLLLREKAFLADSVDEAKADTQQADTWMNKSLDMKRIKAARPAKTTQST